MNLLDRLLSRVSRIAIVLTVIEVIVLVKWLDLAHTAPAVTAAVFLFLGILIEEISRFRSIKGRLPETREMALVGLGVAVETVGWIIGLLIQGPLAQKLAVLFVALEIEHTIIRTATNGSFDLRAVLDFSVVEALGGAIWLAAPSVETVVILAVTSVLEHTQGVRQGFGFRA